MTRSTGVLAAVALMTFLLVPPAVSGQSQPQMGFFITSVGPGDGANLGGREGANQHCQNLASAAGAGNRTWHAYLSTVAAGGQPDIHARDQIGEGPWYNADGRIIAANVADLHGDVQRDRNNIRKPFAVDENGETAMHGAAYKHLPQVATLLADAGADIAVWNQKNSRGASPLDIAIGMHRGMNILSSPATADAIRDAMRAGGVEPDSAP